MPTSGSPVVTFGELLVGIGLIVGALTGFAAFFGSFMNMSFMLSGSASSNPVLFVLAIGVILGWKVAGYYGVDRWLLPVLGTPWATPASWQQPVQRATPRPPGRRPTGRPQATAVSRHPRQPGGGVAIPGRRTGAVSGTDDGAYAHG